MNVTAVFICAPAVGRWFSARFLVYGIPFGVLLVKREIVLKDFKSITTEPQIHQADNLLSKQRIGDALFH